MVEVEIRLKPIGIVHSPYRDMDQAPFQGRMSPAESLVEVFDEYAEGLKEILYVHTPRTGPVPAFP